MFKAGCVAIVHLINPSEKYWGVLQDLSPTGVTLRGINLNSFEDWMVQVARDDQEDLGLSSLFAPLFRVERIDLDEQVGQVESYCQRFERRVGISVPEYLELGDTDSEIPS